MQGTGGRSQAGAPVQMEVAPRPSTEASPAPGPAETVMASPVASDRVVRVRPLRSSEDLAAAEARAMDAQARAREAARLAEEVVRSGSERATPAPIEPLAAPAAAQPVQAQQATPTPPGPARASLRPIEMRLPPGLAAHVSTEGIPAQTAPQDQITAEARLARAQTPLTPAASARSVATAPVGATVVVLGTVGSPGEARAALARARAALPENETGVQLIAEPSGAGFRIVARGFSSAQSAQGFCTRAARQGLSCGN